VKQTKNKKIKCMWNYNLKTLLFFLKKKICCDESIYKLNIFCTEVLTNCIVYNKLVKAAFILVHILQTKHRYNLFWQLDTSSKIHRLESYFVPSNTHRPSSSLFYYSEFHKICDIWYVNLINYVLSQSKHILLNYIKNFLL